MKRVLLLVAAVALLAVACGSDQSESGFGLSADQLAAITTSTTSAPPDPARWEVEVATAVVPLVVARCQPPPELADPPGDGADVGPEGAEPAEAVATPVGLAGDDCQQVAPPEGRPQLTAIPSAEPNVTSALVDGGWSFNHPTYFGNPLVFLVTENHGDWLKVMVPTRPNQQEGWIQASDVELSSHRWHAEINVADNSLRVWDGDDLKAETGVVDGKGSSPTPLGRFYFNEKIEKYPSSDFGSWIFSTNGYSDTLDTFSGGLPVFAVHGTNNPAQIGSDISNGCVRVPNEVIEQMAAQVPMGTPVDVVG